MPRHAPLDSLTHRRTRIKLLLATYTDHHTPLRAADSETHAPGKPGSRDLRRTDPTWHEGSYRELERTMDELRSRSHAVYFHTWNLYVLGIDHAPTRRGKARAGLEYLMRRMPKAVYVPGDVARNAGYLHGADDYARARKQQIAA